MRSNDGWWWQLSKHSSLLGFLFIGSLLYTSAVVTSIGADGSETVEDLLLAVLVSDLGVLDNLFLLLNWHCDTLRLVVGHSSLEFLGGGIRHVTLLGLKITAGENNKLALVFVESSGVHLKLLLTGASSSVIYGDSDASGLDGVQTGSLQFGQGETTSEADFTSIAAGSLRNNGSEGVGGSWENLGSLGLSDLMSLSLLRGLVEVGLDSNTFPVLTKMHVDNHVVMLDHC
jgi:hypothetical protein